MPTRLVREGIIDSRAINSLSEESELFYRRLMSVVDDFGRFTADVDVLRARVFPLQLDRWNAERIEKCLSDVSRARTDDGQSLVSVYSVNGSVKKYLQINNFQQRTRSQSRYPEPPKNVPPHTPRSNDRQMPDMCPPKAYAYSDAEAKTDANANAAHAPVGAAQFELVAAPAVPSSKPGPLTVIQHRWFVVWWDAYWLKKSRKDAEKAFARVVTTEVKFSEIMRATQSQTPEMLSRDPDKRPYPATWLNGERWKDEPEKMQPSRVQVPTAQQPAQGNSLANRTIALMQKRIANGEKPL